jgi:chromosome condensin MukBEF ATPase and DNA-binding subunit MukB
MATATGKTRCVICTKEKATMRCGGCFEEYCFNHMTDHRQQLNIQLDEIEINRDLFRQSLTQQIEQPNNQTLIQQINQWELKSIKTIQQTAEEARQLVLKSSNKYHHQLEVKLDELTSQIRESRHENDFNEINLRQFQEELDILTKQLTKPSIISIREDSTSFISRISVHVSSISDNLIPNGEN